MKFHLGPVFHQRLVLCWKSEGLGPQEGGREMSVRWVNSNCGMERVWRVQKIFRVKPEGEELRSTDNC